MLQPSDRDNLTEQEHAHLLLRCRNGDRQAFDVLWTSVEYQVQQKLFRATGNWEVAQELAQEIGIKVYRKACVERVKIDCFEAYCLRAAGHIAIDYHRWEQRQLVVSREDATNQLAIIPAKEVQPTQMSLWLREMLDVLSDREREVLVRIHFEGETANELAAAMNCSQVRIRQILRKVYVRLKTLFGDRF